MAGLMEALSKAKREGKRLHIVYRGLPPEVTEHVITPLEWIVEDLFRAYCHTTGQERNFHMFSIASWSWATGESGGGAAKPVESDARNRKVDEGTQAMDFQAVITAAMNSRGRVRIEYRDYNGNYTVRDISPLHWESPDKVRAYCHLREEERSFRTFNMRSCEPVDSQAAPAARPASPAPPPVVRPVAPTPAPAISAVRAVPRVRATPPVSTQPRLRQVQSGEDWSRLMSYFADCLERENRQHSLVKDTSRAHFFAADRDHLRRFMAGLVSMEFDTTRSTDAAKLAKFIRDGRKYRDQILCMGYPCYVLGPGTLAPLLISPVKAEEANGQIRLSADECEISLAALDKLRLTEEETAAILRECAQVEPEPGQLLTSALEAYLARRITEILGQPLNETHWQGQMPVTLVAGTLYTGPCLFWMSPNVATVNLIAELRELASPSRWPQVPVPVKQLLSVIPEHDYPAAIAYSQDATPYVSAVNDRQRQAIASAQTEPVVVVTGPPGTGKSQLILSLIAQSTQRGETVLFASHNNKAVNVVMERLRQGVGFSGAVRTGALEYRRAAVHTMAGVMDQLSAAPRTAKTADVRERYAKLKQGRTEAEAVLHHIRELQGLAESHQAECAELLKLIPAKAAELARSHPPPFRPDEAEHFQRVLSGLRQSAAGLRQQHEILLTDVAQLVRHNARGIPLLSALRRFSDQWGSFGDRLLDPPNLESLEQIEAYLSSWLDLLPVLEQQATAQAAASRFRHLSSTWEETSLGLSDDERMRVENLTSSLPASLLKQLAEQGQKLAAEARALAGRRITLWERFLIRLGLRNPVRALGERLSTLVAGLSETLELPQASSPDERAKLAAMAEETTRVLDASVLRLELEQARAGMEVAQTQADEALAGLSPNLQADIPRVSLSPGSTEPLRGELLVLQSRAKALLAERQRLLERVNAKIDGNVDSLRMLSEFRASPAGDHKRLWVLKETAGPVAIVGRLAEWRDIVSLWATSAALTRIERDLKALLPEADALATVKELDKQLYAAGAELTSVSWFERVKGLSNDLLEQTHRYVAAVRQLVAGDGAEPSEWQHRRELRAAEAACLPAVLQVFPVWATTNLAAKSNLPLTPGLFDIAVIDEASQCDIPSALPLLYRAKRVVIIGDPKQLRHVATLDPRADAELATKHSIAPDAFAYSDLSLFDISQRAAGNRPAPLLLNEHYRSDIQIIGFSNAEFYGRQLIVRTDLARLSLPEEFLKSAGGVYWLDVKGEAQHPAGGGAFNTAEIHALRKLVPWLVDNLARRKLEQASLGIVTPYREQEQRIRQWFNESYGLADSPEARIAGTAHKFQGDEKDIILFSPVLAPGLNQGNLQWLQNTSNLLNVAVTRARLVLIVVGHYEFCRALPAGNVYRRLADYIGRLAGRVVEDVTELTLFTGEPFNVIGTLVDRRDQAINRTTLRRLLLSCKGFIWWMDPYMTDKAFEYLSSVCQDPDFAVTEMRVLTIREQLEGRDGNAPTLTREAMTAAQIELRQRGITLKIGLVPKSNLPHDRYLYSQAQAINMPPIMGAIGEHRMVSEYTQSGTTPDFFEQHWAMAQAI
ncbi:MAG: AAA family ATPase [Anaerolineales bacterium]|nr:AAA family ATPase [Anaerolineales bacterium]